MDTRCIHFSSLISAVRVLDSFQPSLGRITSHPRKEFLLLQVTSPRKSLCSAENLSGTFTNLGLLLLPGDPGEFCSTEGALPAGFPWEWFVRDVLVPPFHVLDPGSAGELGWGCHSTQASLHYRLSSLNFIPPWGHTSAHPIRHLCGCCRLQRNISMTPVEVGEGSTRAKDTLMKT